MFILSLNNFNLNMEEVGANFFKKKNPILEEIYDTFSLKVGLVHNMRANLWPKNRKKNIINSCKFGYFIYLIKRNDFIFISSSFIYRNHIIMSLQCITCFIPSFYCKSILLLPI